ncbi:unnamed protein product [Cylindrotheca closterium]|uniref:Phosphodiesterase n=1 Tax=Cylindrotheca closterium TaxID=2856 RepID=A0AAD2PX34_9STRA|nr:unnamed protein product [Cylindrotheca closterium]
MVKRKVAMQSMMKETDETEKIIIEGSSENTTQTVRMNTDDRVKQSIHHNPSTTRDTEELERKAISCFRSFILLVMLGATVAAGVGAWVHLGRSEERNFQSDLNIIVEDIRALSQDRVSALVTHSQSLALAFTALAKNAKAEWPYYTELNFPLIASNFLRATGSHMVLLSPIVHNQTGYVKWSNYSQANQQWIQAGIEFQEETQARMFGESTSHRDQDHRHHDHKAPAIPSIFPHIFRLAEGKAVVDDSTGPFLPSWQMADAPTNPTVVNYNLLSDNHFADVFDAVLSTDSPTMTDILSVSLLEWEKLLASDKYQHGHSDAPFNMLLCPVHRDVENEEVVGILMSDVNWLPLFALASDEEIPAVHVVVDDGCQRKFTLQVSGLNVDFMGFDDFHESEFDAYKKSFPFSSDLPSVHVAGPHCSYTAHVYPTREFWEAYHTDSPVSRAGMIGGVFLAMSFILCLYDLAVNMRQKRILRVAARSEEILSLLYPKNIRDRLFSDKMGTEKTLDMSSKSLEGNFLSGTKHQLKSFLGSAPTGILHCQDSFDSKPIADLFLDTTVFCADIAGFTAWSSVREPTQVFTLLESVFCSFDKIARKRNVFKVETVGDSYVAVTGLPEPTKDHASIMALFARECVARFGQLVGTLETTLGPETGDLGIRVGLHSGPVTAGVLRGDKSRFQLFGDTVNTAARIESTGKRNRIQVSSETASLLRKAGKADWLLLREGRVCAKGKGSLQTYWLLTRKEEAGGVREPSLRREMVKPLPTSIVKPGVRLSASSFAHIEQMLSPRLRRLCQLEAQISEEHIVLEELVDVIALPGFDPVVHQRIQNPEDVILSKEVVDQIRLFVVCIAGMYHANPFHNFDHASHVMMSVSKLLSRIVGENDDMMEGQKANDDNTYGITSDPMTHFSVVLAALVHDIDHLGVSNSQLVQEGHELAGRFQNRSVAEQNSTVLAWDLLMDARFDAFRRTIYVDQFELKRFRQLMANTVLATDIMDKELQTLRRNRWNCAFSSNDIITTTTTTRENVNRKATIVIEHLIQASDVSHTMQHWHIYCKWNERLFEEMTVAYQADRFSKNPAEFWYEGELSFFDNYVIPLAKKLKDCGVFGVSSDEYLNYAMENRQEWKEKGREIVAEMVQRYHE